MEKPKTDLRTSLEAWRTWAGLTQREFADALGVAQPFIAAIESGRKELPEARVEQAREILEAHAAARATFQSTIRQIIQDLDPWTEEDERRLRAEFQRRAAQLKCE